MRIMNGIFAIEKPSGITSSKFIGDLQYLFTKSKVFEADLIEAKNKVIANLSTDKSWSKQRIEKKANSVKVKIGHGGTLDPLASGVLVIGIGQGTKKLQYYLGECNKTYETKALLGISTTTGDSEGEILTKNETGHITKSLVNESVVKFVGDLKQTPPIFSALKMNGKPLYDYAREGKPLPFPIKTRQVKVTDITVVQDDLLTLEHEFPKLESQLDENGEPKENSLFNNPTLNDSPLYFSNQYLEKCEAEGLPKEAGKPKVTKELPEKLPLIHFVTDVSSGTYIRSLISDIGRSMESSAYMVELKRLKQSNWHLGKNVFKYDDFKKDEKVWGPVLKEVLDKGYEIDLQELFQKYSSQAEDSTETDTRAQEDTTSTLPDSTGDQSSESELGAKEKKRTIDQVE
ncbi:tRNA pseudouridine synthase 4 [[Candida] jaroonii]|uniref:tRNA pseudouridine synthase 4 n=1 Tax=[Candida] jaroonii TaxID=467808 RepID=A0ACA9YDS1_9ASCO|nr:tRNA pseudouridine synthase 4 [[Candida] jaroonii]